MKDKWTGERLEPHILNETTIEHLHRYAIAMDLVENKKVLDIACGEGYGANLLATKAAHVTGMDNDESVIAQAVIRYKKQNMNVIAGDAETIALPAVSYEVFTCLETIEQVADQEQMVNAIKKVLNTRAYALTSTTNKKT